MQIVAAALIRENGKLLIAQRSGSGPHPLKWEFPGGKVEHGESSEQALIRELNEELGIDAVPGEEFTSYEFAYPGKNALRLVFLEVKSYSGRIENRGAFEKLVWESARNLVKYDFLEGDLALVELLGKVEID